MICSDGLLDHAEDLAKADNHRFQRMVLAVASAATGLVTRQNLC
jgi:hypothetical protein